MNLITKIAIVDDHILIAKALTSIIEKFGDYDVLFEVQNGIELIEKFKIGKNVPDIVLLDISMPGMDGFETAAWLKEHHPGVRIVALSMQGDDESLIKMIRAGSTGYLSKNIHPAELLKALDTVRDKGFYYPEWATNRLLHNLVNNTESSEVPLKLSAREIEFLKYSCTELTYKEIGEKMFCSARTVESYRDSLFQKIGVKTRVALALFAVKSGIIKL